MRHKQSGLEMGFSIFSTILTGPCTCCIGSSGVTATARTYQHLHSVEMRRNTPSAGDGLSTAALSAVGLGEKAAVGGGGGGGAGTF